VAYLANIGQPAVGVGLRNSATMVRLLNRQDSA
jgi:hypothetical protein